MKSLRTLFVLALFSSVSHAGIEYAHQDSKVSACPDGSHATVTGVLVDLDVYCYGDFGDTFLVSVDNRKLSNDPTDGVLVHTESPNQCGMFTRYIDLRDVAGQIDLHRVVHARVITMANTYPAVIKQILFTHDCP